MKKKFTLWSLLLFIALSIFPDNGKAQCLPGYTAAELNWDNLDFLPSNNMRYTSFYPSAAFPYNQNFTVGTRRVTFAMAPQANITLNGENGINTAHAGSFAAAGDDVQFTTSATANTTVTMTFDANVGNLRFSLFDLDSGQRVTITATNMAGVSQNISIAKANAGSAITINGSGTTSSNATGPTGTPYANNDNRGTINVRIDSLVNRVVLTFSTVIGDVWLSDVDACITGSFPNNYQQISRPFTGQPQYVITVVNNNVYYVNPKNGRGYFLFNEPGHDRLNSMAYDPYRRIVYYTYSLTDRVGLNPQNDKTLKKYDVDSKTISVVIPNVNTFGIPTYESGVESGAASFYNGSLYLGIEGYTGTSGTGSYAASRKSTIWKIDFDAAGNPVAPAAQVFGVTADDGVNAQNIHDWSDFGISNGTLTDFDGSQSGDVDFYQFNLMTGAVINYIPAGTLVPRQVSIGWDEQLYNVDATISRYNGTTGVDSVFTIFAPLGPTIPVGTSVASWGDAAGPYRPFLDFGDAPASYDPDPLSPACHDTLTPNVAGRRTRMRLGPDEDVEWLKRGFTTVEDNFEDGLTFVPIFSSTSSSYLANVTVFNNTGDTATLCAWLDFNGNGFFDAAEGITPINVLSSTLTQTFTLSWTGIPGPITTNPFTYLRIRITAEDFNMTKANSTGYYDMGEVEDYRVIVNSIVLESSLISFDATAIDNKKVRLTWTASEDANFTGYNLQRSQDGANWEDLVFIPGVDAGLHQYAWIDNAPHKGTNVYRLRLNEADGSIKYSHLVSARISDAVIPFTVFPNPARDKTTITLNGDFDNQLAKIYVLNIKGDDLLVNEVLLNRGINSVELPLKSSWPRGTYIVRIVVGKNIMSKKLTVL